MLPHLLPQKYCASPVWSLWTGQAVGDQPASFAWSTDGPPLLPPPHFPTQATDLRDPKQQSTQPMSRFMTLTQN